MKNGFTLVEIIAVIAIIGVLSIMIIPQVLESLNEAAENSMTISEHEIVDAANLFLEDYCRNPIDDEAALECGKYRKNVPSQSGKVYFCLSVLQGKGIIKNVYYKESTSCLGLVVYDYNTGKYSNPKAYLYCGEDYTTEGGSAYESYTGNCGGN